MNRAAFSLLTLSLGVCAAGCGNPDGAKHVLEGSLSVVMDLGWDTATIDNSNVDPTSPDSDIAVSFIRVHGMLQDVSLKVTYALDGQALNTPSTLDLAEPRMDNGLPRGSISRSTTNDVRTTFPNIVKGRLIFYDQIKPGAHVNGEINATFEDGIEFANGRTVFGPFDAQMPP